MKLLVDMNLSPSWAERLARHGFEAVHWSVIGTPGSPDDEILVNDPGRPPAQTGPWPESRVFRVTNDA